jgi:hypothetical protein
VCQKRIALAGQGKSGGTRTLVAKQHAFAIIFLVGREKSGEERTRDRLFRCGG